MWILSPHSNRKMLVVAVLAQKWQDVEAELISKHACIFHSCIVLIFVELKLTRIGIGLRTAKSGTKLFFPKRFRNAKMRPDVGSC